MERAAPFAPGPEVDPAGLRQWDALLFQEAGPPRLNPDGVTSWLAEAAPAVAPHLLLADDHGDAAIVLHSRWAPHVQASGATGHTCWLAVNPGGRRDASRSSGRTWALCSAHLPTTWQTDPGEWDTALQDLHTAVASARRFSPSCMLGLDSNVRWEPGRAGAEESDDLRRQQLEAILVTLNLRPAPPPDWTHLWRHPAHGTWHRRTIDLFALPASGGPPPVARVREHLRAAALLVFEARRPTLRGWRPRSEEEEHWCHAMLEELTPPRPSCADWHWALSTLSAVLVPPGPRRTEGVGLPRDPLPAELKEDRLRRALAAARDDGDDDARLDRLRKAAWRARQQAMTARRADRLAAAVAGAGRRPTPPWRAPHSLDGEEDRHRWPALLTEHCRAKFASAPSAQERRQRLEALRSWLRARRLDGMRDTAPLLPLGPLLHRLRSAAAPGLDGIPPRLLRDLSPALTATLEQAFRDRLSAFDADDDGALAEGWRMLHVVHLPKPRKPAALLGNWRPISLLPSLTKLYEMWLWQAIELHLPPMPPWVVGFEAGRQPYEVAQTIVVLLRRALEWGLPLLVLSLDVRAAFDCLDVPILDAELGRAGVPPLLRAGLLRELVDLQVQPSLGPHRGDRVGYDVGVRQGGPCTPRAWNRMLHFPLERLHRRWADRGEQALAWAPRFDAPLLLWADNVWLIASDEAALRRRAEDVLTTFASLRLEFSDSSLELLANPAAAVDPGPWSAGGRQFARPTQMSVLGVAVSDTADTVDMVQHRCRAAEGAWVRHRPALTDVAVAPWLRWRRWHSTVGESLLWGAPLWRPSSDLRRRLDHLESHHLRRVLRLTRGADESWLAYYRRRRTFETRVRTKAGCTSLFREVLRRTHRWAGHAARTPLSFLSAALRFRDTAEWRTRQLVAASGGVARGDRWRHPHRNWQRDTDAALSSCLGADWKDLASDRHAWKGLETRWIAWATAEFGDIRNPADRERPASEDAAPPRARRRIV